MSTGGAGGRVPGYADQLRDPTGRQLTLLVSDCAGPQWRDGTLQRLVHDWSRTGPVAVLQPLPQRMWRRTHLPALPGRLYGRRGNDPRLGFAPRPGPASRGDGHGSAREGRAAPVPVLAPTAPALATWARLLTGRTPSLPGAAGEVRSDHPETEPGPLGDLEPRGLVRAFQRHASPQALRLAACLSAAPMTLPVMRHVQRAMLPASGPAVLAEVLLSGLVRAQGAEYWYRFNPGVRDVLLRALPAGDARVVLNVCSEYVERHFGRSLHNFPAYALTPPSDETDTHTWGDAQLPAELQPFAEISALVAARCAPPGRSASAPSAPRPPAEPPPQAQPQPQGQEQGQEQAFGEARDAVHRSVVRIGPAHDGVDAPLWGSGFFIAPGWVLTSAHVLTQRRTTARRGEPVIGVTTAAGQRLTGELACALPAPPDPDRPPSRGDAPDIALVRVMTATPGHQAGNGPDADCLWLSDKSDFPLSEVSTHGYVSGPSGVVYMSGTGVAEDSGEGGRLVVHDSWLPSGASGGPVIDTRRASVIGVCQAGAPHSTASMQVTPVTALRAFFDEAPRTRETWQEVLRAHDRHHWARFQSPGPSWPRTQRERSFGNQGFTADRRAELYALFAELPPPTSAAQLLRMVSEVRDELLLTHHESTLHAPRSWREAVGLLCDDGNADDRAEALEEEAVVLFAAKAYVALSSPDQAPDPEPRALDALHTWVEAAGMRLHNDVLRQRVRATLDMADTTVDVTPASAGVLVEIRPDHHGIGRHPWAIRLVGANGETTPVHADEEGMPRTELGRGIRAALAGALDRADAHEHLTAVGFAMPRALFDEPVETWRLDEPRPDAPLAPRTLPLGQRHMVAVRDQRRLAERPSPEWHRRWAAVARGGPLEAVPLCHDVPTLGHARVESGYALHARMLATPEHAVPVHCARVDSGSGATAMATALATGHAAALWRRCDEQHTDCAEFFAHAAALLQRVTAARSLPELVRELRNRNAGADPDAAWARDLVLLYDPPPSRPPS
ncbi:serine protease [Streptomyces diacarni]|uniref:Serine protease n=1 Tax=Streptomyces diacarni TaxID=2800381 RepID=A0A367F2X8_9ACTN|nr:serine protease [Streptomyces diacarni]